MNASAVAREGTLYDRASQGSKAIIDTLEDELRQYIPDLGRENKPSMTTFGAPGYQKFVFGYLKIRKPTVTVYFIGNQDVPPVAVEGMTPLRTRPTFANPRTKLTPFFTEIENLSQVKPFAHFLSDYSVPLAASRRLTGNARTRDQRAVGLAQEVIEGECWEGNVSGITVNRYERDRKARDRCLRFFGNTCQACGMCFESAYGKLDNELIQVHHLKPLSEIRSRYAVNPKTDLIPLCPNCHAVVHHANPPLTLIEIRERVAAKANQIAKNTR